MDHAPPSRPATPPEQTGRPRTTGSSFWKLMRQVAVVSGATHLAFMGLFYGMGASVLAWINLGSVLLFAASHVCLQRRHNLLGSCLIVFEILFHAGLATRVIGWDSGFHYYLLVVVPVVVISQIPRGWIKPMIIAIVGCFYLALDHFMRGVQPVDVLPAHTLTMLRWFNIATTFLLLTYLSNLYMTLVQQAEKRLRLLATTDPLTQLLNRRRMLELAERELQRRDGDVVHAPAFVLADIDHFKAINDRHGHAAGDAVLTKVSEVLRQAVRGQDQVARWGGEEFLVLMPDATLDTARAVAERLRERVAAIDVQFEGRHIEVSMTFGVSRHHGGGESIDASIGRADVALYAGKQAGRNRVTLEAGGPPPHQTAIKA